jgi:hypothetical protein
VHLFEAQPRQIKLERCLGHAKIGAFSAHLAEKYTGTYAVTGDVPAYVTGHVPACGTGRYRSATRGSIALLPELVAIRYRGAGIVPLPFCRSIQD